MSGRSSATRYARALLDVSIREADPVRVGADLSAISSLVSGHSELQGALRNPVVPAGAKRRVVQALLERAPVAAPLGKLLLMLADRDRLALIADLNEVYQERLREHQGVLRAEVTTAVPLDENRADAIRTRLSTATGKHVTLTTKVDPALIGGLIARIGSTVYDGSVAARLIRMRERLLNAR